MTYAALPIGVDPVARRCNTAWQQQRQQEKDVVEARPDVPDALPGVIEELLPGRDSTERESLGGALDAEDGRMRLLPIADLQESAMLGIEIEEKRIAERQ